MKIKYKSYSLIFLIGIGIFAYMAHMQHILNADVASLLYDTDLFLSGGTYIKDFFETNPPMIFILYTPIVMLHKLTLFDIKSLAYIYIVILAYIALAFCYGLLKQIFCEKDNFFRSAFVFVLMCTFLITPTTDFGQREHLLIMLCMPYLLAVVCRAKNIPIPVIQAILIGFMAGLVFSLKPFFLMPIILIECYLMIVKKSFFSWMRTETLVMLCVMVFYLVYVFIYHPLYFNILMPLISQFYFIGTKEDWVTILSKPRVIFCFVIVGYYIFFFQKNYFRELSRVFFLALIGFILTFMIPGSAWNYHVLPAYNIALILSFIYVYAIWEKEINQDTLKLKEAIFIVSAGFFMPMVIFAAEVFQIMQRAHYKDINTLRAKVTAMPHKSIYCFSSMTTGLCFPLVTMSNKEFAGRFPVLWWVRGVRKMENKYKDQQLPLAIARDRNFLIDALAYDLDHYQPELVLTYKEDEVFFLPKGDDYPAYFSKRDSFKKAWAHYQLLETINSFELYQRIKT